jgi:hypothetical protein
VGRGQDKKDRDRGQSQAQGRDREPGDLNRHTQQSYRVSSTDLSQDGAPTAVLGVGIVGTREEGGGD